MTTARNWKWFSWNIPVSVVCEEGHFSFCSSKFSLNLYLNRSKGIFKKERCGSTASFMQRLRAKSNDVSFPTLTCWNKG